MRSAAIQLVRKTKKHSKFSCYDRALWRWIPLDGARAWLERSQWFREWLLSNEAVNDALSAQAGCPYPDWHPSQSKLEAERDPLHSVHPLHQLIDHLASGATHIKQIHLPKKLTPLFKGLTPSIWAAALESYASPRFILPTGQSVEVFYEIGKPPFIKAYLQAFFGERDHPALGDHRLGGSIPLQLHLLAPNRRVAQITSDLSGFWTNSYPEVRRQLRGRYPKHHWPEDPFSIGPQQGAKRRPKK